MNLVNQRDGGAGKVIGERTFFERQESSFINFALIIEALR
jgi:hypothetical protein